MPIGNPKEALIVIDGKELNYAQSMVVRVALNAQTLSMSQPDALGSDKQGRELAAAYLRHTNDVLDIISNAIRDTQDNPNNG